MAEIATMPDAIPEKLVVGDDWQWEVTNNDYPASLWTMTWELVQQAATPASITITATADGDTHAVDVANTTTDDYTAAEYSWQNFVTNIADGDRFLLGRGKVDLLANFAAGTPTDPRSDVKKILDALNSAFVGKASKDQLSYKLPSGLEVRKMTPRQLQDMIAIYEDRYQQECDALAEERGDTVYNNDYIEFTND